MTDHTFGNPLLQDLKPLDNPPMPFEEYRAMMLLRWARQFVVAVSIGMVVAGVIYATKWGF